MAGELGSEPTAQQMNHTKCKVEGCGVMVSTKQKSGLCRKHLHEEGLCNCGLCIRNRASKKRRGPYDPLRPVTLPSAPWEV